MPYYSAGDYYRGDGNYAAGGILGSIGRFLGGAAKTIIKASPIGRIAEAALPTVFGPKTAMPVLQQSFAPPPIPVTPVPGITGGLQRLIPGGATGYEVVPPTGGRRPGDTGRIGHFKKDGTWTNRARPRMNVTNVRALRKAGRRVRGFLKLASRLGALPVSRSGKGKLFKRKRK